MCVCVCVFVCVYVLFVCWELKSWGGGVVLHGFGSLFVRCLGDLQKMFGQDRKTSHIHHKHIEGVALRGPKKK